MKGFIVSYLGQQYKVGSNDSFVSIVCSLVIQRDEFIMEGGSMSGSIIGSWQKIKSGLEIEFEVAEFDDISDDVCTIIDPEYSKMIEKRDEVWDWNWKFKKFREIEKIIKEELLLNC